GGAFLRFDVGGEVGAVEVAVVFHEDVDDRLEDAAAHGGDAVDDGGERGVVADDGGGVVAALADRGDAFDRIAEDEHVLGADLFADLDVRAVERADDQAAVHHRFHAARPRGFGSGGRDLFGEL